MIGTLQFDAENKVINASPSDYKPPDEIRNESIQDRDIFDNGIQLQNETRREFNDMSLIDRLDEDQKAYNAWVPPRSEDPDEAWKSNAVRPIVHNRIIGLTAQVTAVLLFPKFFAQDDKDEEDQLAARIMDTIAQWIANTSDYNEVLFNAINSGLINPAMILEAEFAESVMDIRTRMEDGEIEVEQALDEVFSGFLHNNVPVDELLLSSFYAGHNLQNQDEIMRKRWITLSEAERRYSDHPFFKHVKIGVMMVFNEEDNTFYEVNDEDEDRLILETISYSRRRDRQVAHLNGVYMGKDDPMENRMQHRRLYYNLEGEMRTIPVYPFALSGFEPIDEGDFVYYKSQAFKMWNDYDLLNRHWRMVHDGTFLSVIKPFITSGAGIPTASVIYPGRWTSLPKDAQVQPFDVGTDLNAGYNAINAVEASLTESSQERFLSGQQADPQQKAFNVARAETNARIQMGLFGKMIAKLVSEYGALLSDLIIMHLTAAEAEETLGGDIKLKFRSFLVSDIVENGMKVSRKIEFSDSIMGRSFTREQLVKKQFQLSKRNGFDMSQRLIVANPHIFARRRFTVIVSPDSFLPKNEALEEERKIRAYSLGISNPFIDQKAWTRDFLVDPVAEGETDKYMAKEPQQPISPVANEQTPNQLGGKESLIERSPERSRQELTV